MRFHPGYLAFIYSTTSQQASAANVLRAGIIRTGEIHVQDPCAVNCFVGVVCPCRSAAMIQPIMVAAVPPTVIMAQQQVPVLMAGVPAQTQFVVPQSSPIMIPQSPVPCPDKSGLDAIHALVQKLKGLLPSRDSDDSSQVVEEKSKPDLGSLKVTDISPTSSLDDIRRIVEAFKGTLQSMSEDDSLAQELQRIHRSITEEMDKLMLAGDSAVLPPDAVYSVDDSVDGSDSGNDLAGEHKMARTVAAANRISKWFRRHRKGPGREPIDGAVAGIDPVKLALDAVESDLGNLDLDATKLGEIKNRIELIGQDTDLLPESQGRKQALLSKIEERLAALSTPSIEGDMKPGEGPVAVTSLDDMEKLIDATSSDADKLQKLLDRLNTDKFASSDQAKRVEMKSRLEKMITKAKIRKQIGDYQEEALRDGVSLERVNELYKLVTGLDLKYDQELMRMRSDASIDIGNKLINMRDPQLQSDTKRLGEIEELIPQYGQDADKLQTLLDRLESEEVGPGATSNRNSLIANIRGRIEDLRESGMVGAPKQVDPVADMQIVPFYDSAAYNRWLPRITECETVEQLEQVKSDIEKSDLTEATKHNLRFTLNNKRAELSPSA